MKPPSTGTEFSATFSRSRSTRYSARRSRSSSTRRIASAIASAACVDELRGDQGATTPSSSSDVSHAACWRRSLDAARASPAAASSSIARCSAPSAAAFVDALTSSATSLAASSSARARRDQLRDRLDLALVLAKLVGDLRRLRLRHRRPARDRSLRSLSIGALRVFETTSSRDHDARRLAEPLGELRVLRSGLADSVSESGRNGAQELTHVTRRRARRELERRGHESLSSVSSDDQPGCPSPRRSQPSIVGSLLGTCSERAPAETSGAGGCSASSRRAGSPLSASTRS